MIHLKRHSTLVEGCFGCKATTLNMHAGVFARERQGRGPGFSDEGTGSYVRKMYADRRAAGMEDPEPINSKSAAFAPAKGPIR